MKKLLAIAILVGSVFSVAFGSSATANIIGPGPYANDKQFADNIIGPGPYSNFSSQQG